MMKGIAKTLALLTSLSVLAFGLGAATTGCGKPKVKCDKLCEKMSTCYFDILQKQDKLSQSTIRAVKSSKSLQERFKTNMRKHCSKSCKKYNEQGKWSRKDVKRIKKCIQKDSCSKFTDCVTKYMY